MESENSKYYYCYPCQKTILIQNPELLCPECGSDFLQEAKMPEPEANQAQGIPLDEFLTLFPHIFPNRPAAFTRLIEDLRNRSQPSNRGINILLRNLLQHLNEVAINPQNNEEIVSMDKVLVQANDENECKICASGFAVGEEKFTLGCSHHFHSDCLEPWLKLSNLCPVCKKRVS